MPSINFYDFVAQRLKQEGLPKLNQFQLNVLQDPHRFKTIVWHRKAGKTTMSLIEMLRQSQIRIGTYWIVFPFLDEGRDTVWNGMLFKVIPEDMIAKRNENYMSIKFKNGSYLRLKGADHPESLRGPNVVGIILDEFAKQKLEAWQIMSPMITAPKGWAWFISTPVGKNHLYDYFNRGNSLKNPQWKSWYLKASESGIIDQSELEREYGDLGPEQYSQEYECAWLEGAGQVFRGVGEIINSTPEGPKEGHYYVIGVDVAKHQDWTVMTVFDRSNNRQVYQQRFQRVDWPLQRAEIAQISKHYNNAICVVDATGVGDPMVDELGRISVPVSPIRITESLKREMVQKLSIWIQQKRLQLLPIKETIDELGDYAYKRGPTGKYTYGAPSGRHDDIVMSIALAVLELNPVIIPEVTRTPSPLQIHKQRLIMREEYGSSAEHEWSDGGFDGPI